MYTFTVRLLQVIDLDSAVSAGGRGSQVSDDGWNTVPISKGNRPIDTSRLTKITKVSC